LQRAKDCGLTFGKKKCKFNQERVSYFGVIFSKEGVSPDPKKVADLKNAEAPKSSKEVLSFICMAKAVAADFIPNFSQIAAPIYKLTRKGNKFIWD